MLGRADVVVAACALTSTTRDLMDTAAFGAMRPGSYFINVTRGAVVVEGALIAALASGHLAGALIDVARTEPLPADDPLKDAPNLLITPHTCSDHIGWHYRAAEMFCDNLARLVEGEPPANRVWSNKGY